MRKCDYCSKLFDPKKTGEHPLNTCSFECLKKLKQKKGINFKTFHFKMIPQQGAGKHHQQWITLGNKTKKNKSIWESVKKK